MQQTGVCRGFFSFFFQTLPSTSLHFTPSFLTFYLRTCIAFCFPFIFPSAFEWWRPFGRRDQVTKSKRAPPSPLALLCFARLLATACHSSYALAYDADTRIPISHSNHAS